MTAFSLKPRLSFFLLLLLSCCYCNRSAEPGADASTAGPPAEERFDNDRALVERLNKLDGCAYERGIIDRTCPALHELQTYLRQCDAEPSRRKTATTTLITLLQSKKELTRLAAVETLTRFATSRELKAALADRLAHDPSVSVRAAALSQLCWRDNKAVGERAIQLLQPASQADILQPLRLAAASCLARAESATKPAPRVLAALREETNAAVQAQLCAALGRAGNEAALPSLIPLLDKPDTAGPCSTAVAAIGSEPGYRALLAIVSQSSKGSAARLHPQQLTALQAFAGRPFVQAQELDNALAQVAAGTSVRRELRCRALQLLERRGATGSLRQLEDQTRQLTCSDPAE